MLKLSNPLFLQDRVNKTAIWFEKPHFSLKTFFLCY